MGRNGGFQTELSTLPTSDMRSDKKAWRREGFVARLRNSSYRSFVFYNAMLVKKPQYNQMLNIYTDWNIINTRFHNSLSLHVYRNVS